MSIVGGRNMDQTISAMQQQIDSLERELALVRDSLSAVHRFSESLQSRGADSGHPSKLAKVSVGNGRFYLGFRP